MKIWLIGPTDIVRGWATKLREEYGIEGREYPSRQNPQEVRYYVDIDDRRAAEAYTGPEYQPPDSAGKR